MKKRKKDRRERGTREIHNGERNKQRDRDSKKESEKESFLWLWEFVFFWADARRPIVYEVSRIRDGRSFSTRLVRAKQNGVAVFSTSISYQVDEVRVVNPVNRAFEISEIMLWEVISCGCGWPLDEAERGQYLRSYEVSRTSGCGGPCDKEEEGQ